MTTTQRVDVERLSELLSGIVGDYKVCLGVSQKAFEDFSLRGSPTGKLPNQSWGLHCRRRIEELEALPALLQQLAELSAKVYALELGHETAVETIKMRGQFIDALANDLRAAGCVVDFDASPVVTNPRADAAETKLAEQAVEIERLRSVVASGVPALLELEKANREAAERAREESVELMREVLERDRVRYLNGECVCINHSRKAELEYESGTCPHQRIAAFLAANGGRDEA